MLDSLYFWKNKGGGRSSSKTLLIIVLLLLLIGGSAAGAWYYFIILPEQKAREEALERQHAAVLKLQSDISAVNTFYAKSLEGASIKQSIRFLTEANISFQRLNIFRIESETFVCDIKNCSFSYKYHEGEVLTLPQKVFWDKTYQASVPMKKGKEQNKNQDDFGYKDIESKLNDNPLQTLYKSKKPLSLYPCQNVVSYILTYNSFVKSSTIDDRGQKGTGEIVMKTMPVSSVSNLEPQLIGKVKAYGLMAGTWEIELANKELNISENTMNLQVMLLKQAYRDAFLIKRIETTNKGLKVSGGLVCKI